MATARRSYSEIEEVARRLRRPVAIDKLECPPDGLSIVERLGTRNERNDEGEAWQFPRVFLAPTFLAVGSTVEELVERFGLSGELSQRWKSRTASPADVRDGQGRRVLPKSVIDLLTEAERRGHPITAQDRSDDD